jgi:hypothetical protein
MEKKFILIRRDNLKSVSEKVYISFNDARIDRHKMEIKNPDLIIDIKVVGE